MIYDNFLDVNIATENALLEELKNEKHWIDLYQANNVKCKWWDGKTEPKNLWEKLIKVIWLDRFLIDLDKIKAFEYWCNVLKPDELLGWHQDKDEAVYEIDKRLVHPKISTVFYGYPHSCKEGFLEIAMPNEQDPDAMHERIAPFYNRLIVFDPSRWHRVMPITEGIRLGFQVNIWEEKPSFLLRNTHQSSQDI